MDEDEASDMEMTAGQGNFIAFTGHVKEHRDTGTQKITEVKVSEDTWSRRASKRYSQGIFDSGHQSSCMKHCLWFKRLQI